uniref:Uncharacterized protein n=1 Tax=viral metagenome TaxID=1070528 RepID=A0A6H1Z8I3_9ZZZZ
MKIEFEVRGNRVTVEGQSSEEVTGLAEKLGLIDETGAQPPQEPRDLKSISELQEGSVVRGKLSGDGYTVVAHMGDYAIGTRVVHISNPGEWLLIKE